MCCAYVESPSAAVCTRVPCSVWCFAFTLCAKYGHSGTDQVQGCCLRCCRMDLCAKHGIVTPCMPCSESARHKYPTCQRAIRPTCHTQPVVANMCVRGTQVPLRQHIPGTLCVAKEAADAGTGTDVGRTCAHINTCAWSIRLMHWYGRLD